MGMRHGYFYEWLTDGTIYSRKYYQNDLEDFGRFSDEGGISTTGKSMAALELAKWEWVKHPIFILNLLEIPNVVA